MLDVNISDHRLALLFRNHIRTWHNQDAKLRGIKLCGSKIIGIAGNAPKVYVVASDESARFFGVATCHSPWACPACSAKVMAKKCGEIASLIDARKKWFNQSAFMITFTLPHTRLMSCEEAFEVLKKTWRMFMRAGNRNKNSQNKSLGVLGEFRYTFDIKGLARAYEFTWSAINGWHPHIHALFWTKDKNFDKLLPYEDKLTDYWLYCAKHCHKQWLKQHQKEEKTDLDQLYAEYKNRPVTGHRAVWFSKEDDGTIRKEQSSFYVSGWGGNSELTGDIMKESKFEGHYTPFQILKNASKADAKEAPIDGKTAFQWLELYTEYAIATRGSKRVQFAPSDQKLIAKWRSSNEFIETLKKNLTDKAKKTRVVWWFNQRQWSEILFKEATEYQQLRADILYLAIHDPSKIPKLLALSGIHIPNELPENDTIVFLEENILNRYVKASA